MTKLYTFHPAAAVNKISDGASAEKVDNGAPTLFSFWQQKFDSFNELRCYFQAVTVASNIDVTQNVVFKLIFRKLSAATGNVVIELNGRFFDVSTNPSDRETGALSDVNLSTTTGVPAVAVADTEFEISLTEPGASFSGKQGNEFLFEVVRDGAAAGDTYPDDIALVRVDVIQEEVSSTYWQAGAAPGTIHYSSGNVGVGVNPPLESLHCSGAVILGGTATPSPPNGTLRWSGSDIEGWKAGAWFSLTAGASGNTLDQAYDQGGAGVGRAINIINSGGSDLPVLLQRDVSNPDYGLQLEDELRVGLGSGVSPNGFLRYSTTPPAGVQLHTVGNIDLNVQTGDVGGSVTGSLGLHTGNGSDSGSLDIYSGTGSSSTGAIDIYTGVSSTADSGVVSLRTGNASNNSGRIDIYSGNGSAGSGLIQVATGTAGSDPSGGISLVTGASSGDVSGDINFTTGTGTESGDINFLTSSSPVRGDVTFDCDLVDYTTERGLLLREVSGTPVGGVNYGVLYTTDDSGDTELYYRDNSNNAVRLTEDGYATAGIGTDEPYWTVNKDNPGTISEDTSLYLRDGDGANIVLYGFQVENTASELSLQHWVGLSESGVVLNFGSFGSMNPVTHELIFNVLGGPGTLSYEYDGAISDSRWSFDHPIFLPDNIRAYFGTSYDSSIYYDSATTSLLMSSADLSSGTSHNVGIGTGDIGSGTGVGNTGTIQLATGDTGTGDSGALLISTGGVATSGTSGVIGISTGTSLGESGDLVISTGTASLTSSGDIIISSGDGTGVNHVDSGDITIQTGAKANEGDRGDIYLSSQNNVQTTEADFYIVPGGDTSGVDLARYPLQVGTASDNVISGSVNKVAIHRCTIASELVLQAADGTYYALWVDSSGRLRIESIGTITTDHTSDTSGTVVGTQT